MDLSVDGWITEINLKPYSVFIFVSMDQINVGTRLSPREIEKRRFLLVLGPFVFKNAYTTSKWYMRLQVPKEYYLFVVDKYFSSPKTPWSSACTLYLSNTPSIH